MIPSLAQQHRSNLLEPRRGKKTAYAILTFIRGHPLLQTQHRNLTYLKNIWKRVARQVPTMLPRKCLRTEGGWGTRLLSKQSFSNGGLVSAIKKAFTYLYVQGTKIINSGKYFQYNRKKHWLVIAPKCISTWDTKQDKCSHSSNTTFEKYCSLLGCMVHRNIQHAFDSIARTKVCIMIN